jgi:hypothetical protein
MTPETFLFGLLAAILLAVIYALWRYWDGLVDTSPDEEEYDRQVADLNERQANRMSDERLTKPPSDDDAWQIILRRGRRLSRQPRYGHDLSRRTRERRKREKT